MSKEVLFRKDTKAKFLKGVETIESAVGATLGPKGRNVIIYKRYGPPAITKDGVTVAKEIELKDPYEDMAAKIVREAAAKTAITAGDGTTTATLLAADIYRQGQQSVDEGMNPILINRGISLAVKEVVAHVKSQAKEVSSRQDIENIATVSANWDRDIGKMIADAFDQVGKDGTITVEEANSIKSSLIVVEGMQFRQGYLSPYFCTDPVRMVCEFQDCRILCVNKKISNPQELAPVLELAASKKWPLLIIADDVDMEPLGLMTYNRMRGAIQCCAVKAPAFQEIKRSTLEDIAALTGGKVISDELGTTLETINTSHFGFAKKVTIDKDSTTIVEGGGSSEEIAARIQQIKTQLADATNDYDKEKLQERLAKLAGGVAIIKVGAATEPEMKEKKDRLDDALCATRAAVEEGIVAGGGVALLSAATALERLAHQPHQMQEVKTGITIVRRAIEAPLRYLCKNAGLNADMIVNDVLPVAPQSGYNVATEKIENLIEVGVVDPAKVVRCAIENASSAAGLLLTTEASIVEEKEEAIKDSFRQ